MLWPLRLTFQADRRLRPEQAAIVLLGAAALILPFFLHPGPRWLGTHTQLFLAPCFFYRLVGLPCPTCGMTTSFTALAHGRWRAAFLAHPLGPPFYLYLLVLELLLGVNAARGRAVHLTWQAGPVLTAAAVALAWGCRLAAWFLSRTG